MAYKALKPCKQIGCPELVQSGYCGKHKKKDYECRRGNSSERGYDNRWRNYSKAFLKKLGNQLCKLKIDEGCSYIAECVDHIKPPNGKGDPLFWDKANHQSACIHCNSVKGNRIMTESD
jgi:5-methylcytosine-specific restriction enzyme A